MTLNLDTVRRVRPFRFDAVIEWLEGQKQIAEKDVNAAYAAKYLTPKSFTTRTAWRKYMVARRRWIRGHEAVRTVLV